MKTKHIPIDPPGRILLEEFIEPSELTQKEVSSACNIDYIRFNELINGKRRVTAEYAIKLATYFDTSPELWLRLQADYDLRITERKNGKRIRSKVTPIAA